MSELCLKVRNKTLSFENVLFVLLLAFAAPAQATDIGWPIKLVLGGSSTALSPGTVVVTRSGYVRGEDGVFPAISSDRGQLAILHVEDPHDPSVSLGIVSVESRSVIEHFELVLADERREALNSDDRDMALAELEDRIRDHLELANQYLSEYGFRTVTELYNIRHIFTGDFLSRENDEQSRVWEEEVGAWAINYDSGTEALEIFSIKTRNTALLVRRPIEVYGMARPGLLCRVRPAPYQGWYDRESDTAIIRLGYFWGGHGCDVADKWLIEKLGSS